MKNEGLIQNARRASGNREFEFWPLSLTLTSLDLNLLFIGGPNGSRTRVLALRGPRPRPLDDGTGMAGERGFEPL